LADLADAFNLMTERVRALVLEGVAARARLETIFANLSDGVAIVDERWRVTGLNRAAASILAADERDAIGRPFASVSASADLAQLLRDAFGDGDLKMAVIEDDRPGRTIEAHAQVVSTDSGRIGIVVIRDLTELRRLELVRREFVANVSHELRTPLASIRALVETLESGAASDLELGPRFMSQAIDEVDRVTGLVDELLDLARLESGRLTLRLETIPAAPLLSGAMERLRPQTERAGLRLFAAFSEDLPDVNVDPGRIEQVMLNLIHNAIKFTPAGGVITVRAVESNAKLRIEVVDTGIGITEADVPRLFERFYKSDKARRSEGSGLGLAIAKHIILAHGGDIWAASEPGSGATFSFTLPLAVQRRDDRGSSAS
jgi:two-component system phosphate regulon sensor histidine kinase PhoR